MSKNHYSFSALIASLRFNWGRLDCMASARNAAARALDGTRRRTELQLDWESVRHILLVLSIQTLHYTRTDGKKFLKEIRGTPSGLRPDDTLPRRISGEVPGSFQSGPDLLFAGQESFRQKHSLRLDFRQPQ